MALIASSRLSSFPQSCLDECPAPPLCLLNIGVLCSWLPLRSRSFIHPFILRSTLPSHPCVQKPKKMPLRLVEKGRLTMKLPKSRILFFYTKRKKISRVVCPSVLRFPAFPSRVKLSLDLSVLFDLLASPLLSFGRHPSSNGFPRSLPSFILCHLPLSLYPF